jgi:hypothetical protein
LSSPIGSILVETKLLWADSSRSAVFHLIACSYSRNTPHRWIADPGIPGCCNLSPPCVILGSALPLRFWPFSSVTESNSVFTNFFLALG